MSHTSHNTKQTAETARRARAILKLRRKGKTWEKASSETGIIKSDGSPDPGLAYRIALEEYEPKSQEVRDRLGLKKLCLSCMRAFRKTSKKISALPPWRYWWNRLKPGERERWIKKNYEEGNRQR